MEKYKSDSGYIFWGHGNSDSEILDKVNNSIWNLKLQNHDERLDKLEAGLKTVTDNMEQFNYASDFKRLYDIPFLTSEDLMLENEMSQSVITDPMDSDVLALEDTVKEFMDNDDLQYQVQVSAKLVMEIRELLDKIPKQKNNFRRHLLLLMHGAVKRNYSKHIFTSQQIKVFLEMAKSCRKKQVTKEEYYEYDEELYECDLEVLPAGE